MSFKRCSKCGVEKPHADFLKRKGSRDGLRGECKRCHADACLARDHKNPEATYIRKRKSSLKKHYGITLDEYEAMLDRQGGVCALCGDACSTGMALAVDHCHSSGRVRELLCHDCNTGLGKFRDCTILLTKAISYLQLHRSTQ